MGFPDQFKLKGKVPVAKTNKVVVQYKGKTEVVKPSEVDAYISSAQGVFSFATNLVPFMQNTQGNRASMGGRMMQQAVALSDKEAPLVQVTNKDKLVYEKLIGNYLNPVLGEGKGTVSKITKDYITINKTDGTVVKKGLYNNFPLNQDGFLHSEVKVKVGDPVTSKTLLADSNYSSNGVLALGKNLTVAYMP